MNRNERQAKIESYGRAYQTLIDALEEFPLASRDVEFPTSVEGASATSGRSMRWSCTSRIAKRTRTFAAAAASPSRGVWCSVTMRISGPSSLTANPLKGNKSTDDALELFRWLLSVSKATPTS